MKDCARSYSKYMCGKLHERINGQDCTCCSGYISDINLNGEGHGNSRSVNCIFFLKTIFCFVFINTIHNKF